VGFEVQAHRGNDALTLQRLLDARPSSVEVDVGLSSSGLVIAHETDLSDASGLTVDELLLTAGETAVVLEVKCRPGETPGPEAFAAALRPLLDRVSVGSFEERVLVEVARLRPETPTTFLFERQRRTSGIAVTIGPRHDLVSRDLVDRAHEDGVRVVPWTVNDVQTMAELIDLGVDGLVTDQPELAQAVVASRLPRQDRRSVA
jgi:hypothetical protein